MYNAYETVKKWLKSEKIKKIEVFEAAFRDFVTLIWYEVNENSGKTPEKLFTDINAGKIKLTSSELLKAVFYKPDCSNNIKLEEIAFQWDEIERELHEEAFGNFLTNETSDKYPTRIDLILDLKAKVLEDDKIKDEYKTFFELQKQINEYKKNDNISEEKAKTKLWKEIVKIFLLLRDWYNDCDLYNKTAYNEKN